jgi:hypothetical protein
MLYKLSPQYKKSAADIENWFKVDESGNKMWIEREYGWRWASCTFESETPPEIDLANEHGFNIYEDIDEEIQDYEADDGCWSDYRYSDNISEEYRARLDEMDHDELEEDGWRLSYVDTHFMGPLVLEDAHGNVMYGDHR